MAVRENHIEVTSKIVSTLKEAGIRIDHISGDESLGKRIHAAKKFNTPYIIIVGDKETQSGILTIEKRDGSKVEMSLEDFLAHIQKEIKERI